MAEPPAGPAPDYIPLRSVAEAAAPEVVVPVSITEVCLTMNRVPLRFPVRPYATQVAIMNKVTRCLQASENALIESATGTGKSLALLCSSLATQAYLRSQQPQPQQQPTPRPATPSSPGDDDGETQRPARHMKVIYGTRTHSQAAQIIREVRKTAYAPSTVALASRDRYCVNTAISQLQDRDAECRRMLRAAKSNKSQMDCEFGKHSFRLARMFAEGATPMDVEDLVKAGKRQRACPYLAAKKAAIDAMLVVCPYNYVLDPHVRKAMEIDLSGAAVVIDEAHNAPDFLMGAASTEDFDLLFFDREFCQSLLKMKQGVFSSNMLDPATDEDGEVDEGSTVYEAIDRVHGVASSLCQWAARVSSQLEKTAFEVESKVWRGQDIAQILSSCGITSKKATSSLSRDISGIAEVAPSRGLEAPIISRGLASLEDLLSSVNFFLAKNMQFGTDFRLVLTRARHRDEWTFQLALWCLSASPAMVAIASKARSVVLASGTLAPFDSLAKELGVAFPAQAELAHVIDSQQVTACAVTAFEVTWTTSENLTLQDAIGDALAKLFAVIPSGVLCFFPSYSMLSKMTRRWKSTGAWDAISAAKEGNVFEELGAQAAASQAKGKKGAPQDFKRMLENFRQASSTKGGAALFAVCRGKASEGLDFADDAARAVIVVGIPYPASKELHVVLKREHEDKAFPPNGGTAWYLTQGHRAVNQALGRVIRHRWDYGAVVLLDARYASRNVSDSLSRWLRPSLVSVPSVDAAAQLLSEFYPRAQAHVSEHAPTPPATSSTSSSCVNPPPLKRQR